MGSSGEGLTKWSASEGEVLEIELDGCAFTGGGGVDTEVASNGVGGWDRGGVAYV